MLPLTVTRSVHLDAPADVVWDAIGDARGLERWLAGEIDLDPQPGEAGTLVELDGTRRRIVVTDRHEGERLGFVWWHEDDPAEASAVLIEVGANEEGTTVTVTETADPVAVASIASARSALLSAATVDDVFGGSQPWEARLHRLAGIVSPVPVAVGA